MRGWRPESMVKPTGRPATDVLALQGADRYAIELRRPEAGSFFPGDVCHGCLRGIDANDSRKIAWGLPIGFSLGGPDQGSEAVQL